MFITPISNIQNIYSRNVDLKKEHSNIQFANKPLSADTVSFSGGIKPEVLRNQMKILYAQTINDAKNIDIMMPTNDLEREVALEVLTHRKNLDKYLRLKRERDNLHSQVAYISGLMEENPNNPEITKLSTELKKKGHVSSILTTLEKKLEQEAKKNKTSIEYFKDIDNLQEEYLEKHIIRYGKLTKHYEKMKKYSLNKDGNLSTQDLIEIISGNKQIEKTPVVQKPANRILSKTELLNQVEKQYEQYLQETVNIYMGNSHGAEASQARKFILENNQASIRHNKGIDQQLKKVYQKVEQKFIHKTDRLIDVDSIYPIGDIFKEMDKGVLEMKSYIKAIEAAKTELEKTPQDLKLKRALNKAEKQLATTKKDWLGALEYTIKYEKHNRETFAKAGVLEEYDYLTAKNKLMLRYKELDAMRIENNDSLPEEVWAQILA